MEIWCQSIPQESEGRTKIFKHKIKMGHDIRKIIGDSKSGHLAESNSKIKLFTGDALEGSCFYLK